MATYRLIAMVNSRLEPGKSYKVSVRDDTGAYACSCPSWVYKRGPKVDCKHIKAVKDPYFAKRSEVAERAVRTRRIRRGEYVPTIPSGRPRFVERMDPLDAAILGALDGAGFAQAMSAYLREETPSLYTGNANAGVVLSNEVRKRQTSLVTDLKERLEPLMGAVAPAEPTRKSPPRNARCPELGVRQITLED